MWARKWHGGGRTWNRVHIMRLHRDGRGGAGRSPYQYRRRKAVVVFGGLGAVARATAAGRDYLDG